MRLGNRSLQFVWWGFSRDFEGWYLGFARWPRGETRSQCEKFFGKTFGFVALGLGPIEFRYWPHVVPEQKQKVTTSSPKK